VRGRGRDGAEPEKLTEVRVEVGDIGCKVFVFAAAQSVKKRKCLQAARQGEAEASPRENTPSPVPSRPGTFLCLQSL
jgi:hypothetical protein